jgi:subtilisin family serine protease
MMHPPCCRFAHLPLFALYAAGIASLVLGPWTVFAHDRGDREVQQDRAAHLLALGIPAWHQAGYRGQGITIAVLDSGFRDYHAYLAWTLPADVLTHSFRTDRNLEAKQSQHGLLCGEVIHALAPDAKLLFANWDGDHPEQFLEAMRWARAQGARVVSCSLIMPSWSDGEGGGPVHAALRRILGTGDKPSDVLCVASAGNTAHRHWSGLFQRSKGDWHEFVAGRVDNTLTPWSDERVSVELCWHTDGNFDLLVNDMTTGHEAAASLAAGHPNRRCAVARFVPERTHRYAVRVRLDAGPADAFHLVALGGDLEYSTSHGSISFPADGPEVIAVGAVNRAGERMSYSSCGPNSSRPKPDLMAPVPFPCQCGSRYFSGTSAAAPQAAALAALWWSRNPNWTAAQVRHALRKSARDLGAPGHDYETGYGVIALP